jgi:hypothetical protein
VKCSQRWRSASSWSALPVAAGVGSVRVVAINSS